MAAGLGFKTFNTGDVLSAGDTNGYLMQGVLVFADAAARTAAITSPQEGQASYLKDTNAVEVYTGAAWVSVGGSGGLTSLATGSLSGGTVTLSSISGSYKHLQLVLAGVSSTSASNYTIRLNGISSNTYSTGAIGVNTTQGGFITNDAGTNSWIPTPNVSQAAATITYNTVITFPNYALTSLRTFEATTGIFTDANRYSGYYAYGYQESTSAITSLDINSTGGTFDAGTYTLYGVS